MTGIATLGELRSEDEEAYLKAALELRDVCMHIRHVHDALNVDSDLISQDGLRSAVADLEKAADLLRTVSDKLLYE